MPDKDGKLTQEEFDSLSPSDQSHYKTRKRLGDNFSHGDTESTVAARDAAFQPKASKES